MSRAPDRRRSLAAIKTGFLRGELGKR